MEISIINKILRAADERLSYSDNQTVMSLSNMEK